MIGPGFAEEIWRSVITLIALIAGILAVAGFFLGVFIASRALAQEAPAPGHSCQTIEYVIQEVTKNAPDAKITIYDGVEARRITAAILIQMGTLPFEFVPSHVIVADSPMIKTFRGSIVIGFADHGCAEDEWVYFLPVDTWNGIKELVFGKPI